MILVIDIVIVLAAIFCMALILGTIEISCAVPRPFRCMPGYWFTFSL